MAAAAACAEARALAVGGLPFAPPASLLLHKGSGGGSVSRKWATEGVTTDQQLLLRDRPRVFSSRAPHPHFLRQSSHTCLLPAGEQMLNQMFLSLGPETGFKWTSSFNGGFVFRALMAARGGRGPGRPSVP